MLHQISWFNYAVTLIVLAIGYYAYVGIVFYRHELRSLLHRLTGRGPAPQFAGGDFELPDYEIAGAIKPENVDFITSEELVFGPPEDDQKAAGQPVNAAGNHPKNIRLLGEFSEMISESKTLIRVINESSETKENFEMLFRLIIQKYESLAGTDYEDQVNEFLMNEGAEQFPFPLTLSELQSYWKTEDDKN